MVLGVVTAGIVGGGCCCYWVVGVGVVGMVVVSVGAIVVGDGCGVGC